MSWPTSQGGLRPAYGEHRMLSEQALEVLLAARLELEGRIAGGVVAECRRDEDLAGLRVIGDPRRQHDIAAVEVLGVRDHEPGMEPDPERCERLLELHRGAEAGVCARERAHGRAALALDDLAVVALDHLPQGLRTR